MTWALIGLAFFVGGFLGCLGTALSCTAAPSTFTITPENSPSVVTGGGGTATTQATITTTAAFPGCLAGSLFSLNVEADASA